MILIWIEDRFSLCDHLLRSWCNQHLRPRILTREQSITTSHENRHRDLNQRSKRNKLFSTFSFSSATKTQMTTKGKLTSCCCYIIIRRRWCTSEREREKREASYYGWQWTNVTKTRWGLKNPPPDYVVANRATPSRRRRRLLLSPESRRQLESGRKERTNSCVVT